MEQSSTTGELWRDVVNFVGDDEATPAIYMPLLEHVAVMHPTRGYFLGRLAEKLRKPGDRTAIEGEIGLAAVGYRLWEEQSNAIYRWANSSKDGPYTMDKLETWWLYDGKDWRLEQHARKNVDSLIDAVQFLPDEMPFVQEFLGHKDFRDILVINLRRDLKWLGELHWLRNLAEKTWPADPKRRMAWERADVAFIQEYYEDQLPELDIPDGDEIDPFVIRPLLKEQGLGMGAAELLPCMYMVLRSAVIDFMNDIVEHSRFPSARGSMRCVECGRYAGRRPRGYGQQYCGDRCKKRAAKRRYRAHFQIVGNA